MLKMLWVLGLIMEIHEVSPSGIPDGLPSPGETFELVLKGAFQDTVLYRLEMEEGRGEVLTGRQYPANGRLSFYVHLSSESDLPVLFKLNGEPFVLHPVASFQEIEVVPKQARRWERVKIKTYFTSSTGIVMVRALVHSGGDTIKVDLNEKEDGIFEGEFLCGYERDWDISLEVQSPEVKGRIENIWGFTSKEWKGDERVVVYDRKGFEMDSTIYLVKEKFSSCVWDVWYRGIPDSFPEARIILWYAPDGGRLSLSHKGMHMLEHTSKPFVLIAPGLASWIATYGDSLSREFLSFLGIRFLRSFSPDAYLSTIEGCDSSFAFTVLHAEKNALYYADEVEVTDATPLFRFQGGGVGCAGKKGRFVVFTFDPYKADPSLVDDVIEWLLNEKEEKLENLAVSPNPFINFLEIFPPPGVEVSRIFITDAGGRVVRSLEGTLWDGRGEDNNELPAGCYFIYLVDEKGKVYFAKAVKIR